MFSTKATSMQEPSMQQELFVQILSTNQAYQKFIIKLNSYGYNTVTSTQYPNYCATLRAAQNDLVEKAKKLIEGKLDFLEDFSNLLTKIKQMQNLLENQIESKRITFQQFAAYMTDILKVGREIQQKGKFLLDNWDIQFIRQLHEKKGITEQTIKILIQQNIRRSTIPFLTDEDITQFGIKIIGDKIILRQMIKQH